MLNNFSHELHGRSKHRWEYDIEMDVKPCGQKVCFHCNRIIFMLKKHDIRKTVCLFVC